jgi:predicted nucleic acid-binding protein
VSRAVLVDTSVFAYALGGEHPQREPCRAFLRDARGSGLEMHASVEMVQELTFHRMRLVDAPTAVTQGRLAGRSCILHAFDERVLEAALPMIADGTVRGRDAVHAATAILAGIATIVSTDPAFDAVLERLDPSSL